jgi:hypothetical protein
MEGIALLIIIAIAIVCIALALGTNNEPEVVVSQQNKDYIYSENEYIELYNYCVRKRNAMCNQLAGNYGIPAHSLAKKLRKMDEILDSTTQEYESPYIANDYTKWCRLLLGLLEYEEKVAVNYGKLKEQNDANCVGD